MGVREQGSRVGCSILAVEPGPPGLLSGPQFLPLPAVRLDFPGAFRKRALFWEQELGVFCSVYGRLRSLTFHLPGEAF